MTTIEGKKTTTLKHIRYVGTRPKDDIENDCREKLCHLAKGVGGIVELAAEKLYILNLAKDEDCEAFCEQVENENSPFIFWGFRYSSRIYYDNFDMDFGPLNLAVTHHFVSKIKLWLDTQPYRNPDKIVVIVLDDLSTEVKLNATLLVAIAAMVLLNLTDEEVLQRLNFFMLWKYNKPGEQLTFREKKKFTDVSGSQSLMTLRLEDCIKAFYAALKNKFYDYYTFDQTEYLFYETVMSGDINWIVPGKLLAFAGPSESSKRPPSFYYHYFADHHVTNVVRLNDSEYSSKDFEDVGFIHDDLIFLDGYPPSSTIAKKFIKIVDNAAGAVAVHCYAGIGRTGTLIAAYLMARYNFTAAMAIAWTRICRPGSVIGGQQDWLLTKFDQYSVGQCKGPQISRNEATGSSRNPSNKTPQVELTASATTTTKPETPLRTSSRQAQSRADQAEAAAAAAKEHPETSFKVAERNYGQAKALVLTKKEREKQIFAQHRRQLFLKHKEQATRSSSRTRNSTERNNGAGCEPVSSQTGDEAMRVDSPTKAPAADVVLDLGRTIPFNLRFSDLAKFEGKKNPKFYFLEDGKYNWKVKFPEAGYVKLKYDYLHDKNVTEFYTDDGSAREPMLNFRYRRESSKQSPAQDDSDLVDEQETTLPRLVPIVFYSLFGL